MAISQIGTNASSISIQIEGMGKAIVGIEGISGFGLEQELAKVRGSGGEWHRGYSGPGFKSVSDGTLSLWLTTFYEWLRVSGGTENDLMNKEFTITIVTQSASNPTITTKIKNCKVISAPMNLPLGTADNLLVEVSVRAIKIESKIG